MIETARSEEFAFPAVNVSSSQTLNAALQGLAEARSDGIVQITTSAADYLSGSAHDMAAGAHAFAAFAHVAAARAPTLVALHTDHCTPENVDRFLRPLLAHSRQRRQAGAPPLFNSHMFDGSQLPLGENLRISANLLSEVRELGVLFEFEIGTVGGEEDGINHLDTPRTRLYTTPADALAVAEALGLDDGYLLAATFGNVHGHYAPGHVHLRPELLGELQIAVRQVHGGRGFAFVFHGGSGSTEDELAAAIRYGVVKVNVDTDMQLAFSKAVENHFLHEKTEREELVVDKSVYDPRTWGRRGELAMAERVRRACQLFGSAGRTLVRA
jgi:fructose-bisphosphate aldolase class II